MRERVTLPGLKAFEDTRVQNAVVIGISLLLFVATMPESITLEDAGMFQMICHLGGIAHPPGYPLFTQLCSRMMMSPTVTAGNMVSAVFAALAAGVLYRVVILLTRSNITGFVAALAYACSATFWSQAIIIEVYSLAALMFMICWWLLLKFVDSQQLKYWFALCLAAGLSVSNHWPLFLLSCAGFVPLLYGARQSLAEAARSLKFWTISILLFILGLTPYISLLTETDPQIAAFGAVNPEGFLNYIARSYYADSRAGAVIHDKLQYFIWLLPETLFQLGFAALPVMLLGVYRSFKQLKLNHAVSLLFIYLATTYLLMCFFNFPFEILFQGVFRPYPVIAFSALAIWFAIGLVWSLEKLQREGLPAQLRISLVLIFLVSIAAYNYPKLERSDDKLVDQYARTVLASLPENAILFLTGDNQVGPLGFLNRVEGFRLDVTLYEKESLVFSNRLTGVGEPKEQKERVVNAFISNATRPVFSIYGTKEATSNYGLYYGYNRFSDREFVFVPEFEVYLDQLLALHKGRLLTDLHERQFVYDLIISFARQYAGYVLKFGTQALSAQQIDRLHRVQETFPGKLATLEAIIHTGTPTESSHLIGLAEAAHRQLDGEVPKKDAAVFYLFYGLIMAATDQEKKAVEMFSKSLELMPDERNESICELMKIYEKNTDRRNLARLKHRFPAKSC